MGEKETTQECIKQNKKIEEEKIIKTVKSSSHYIPDLIDAHAAKGNDADCDSDQSDFDLSDGFDEDGQPAELPDVSSNADSKRSLMRFQSKRNWNASKLDEHEDDLLAEMQRLSEINR